MYDMTPLLQGPGYQQRRLHHEERDGVRLHQVGAAAEQGRGGRGF